MELWGYHMVAAYCRIGLSLLDWTFGSCCAAMEALLFSLGLAFFFLYSYWFYLLGAHPGILTVWRRLTQSFIHFIGRHVQGLNPQLHLLSSVLCKAIPHNRVGYTMQALLTL